MIPELVFTISWNTHERVKVIYAHLNIILTIIVFLALTVLVVSALGMASATGFINIMERTQRNRRA